MKLRIALLSLVSIGTISCGSYRLKSERGTEQPCYSTWHWHPHNS